MSPFETPSDSHDSSSSGHMSLEPSQETIDKHEAGNLRSSILEDFENRFADVTDEDAEVFIELLSYFSNSAKLRELKEEFKNYEGNAMSKDWIRILAQEIPFEQLRANDVIKSRASYLITEMERLAPLEGSLQSVGEAHRESMEQRRAAVLPQAEEYCSLYFSDADSSVRECAKANLLQLLVDGYVFNERIQHVSGGPIVMDFSRPKKPGHLFLYPNGEIFNRLPGRRVSRVETSSDVTPSIQEVTQTPTRTWDSLTDGEKKVARTLANRPWDSLTDEERELTWIFTNSPEANQSFFDPEWHHYPDKADSDEGDAPQSGESNVMHGSAELEKSREYQASGDAFLTLMGDIKENPPVTNDPLIKETDSNVPLDEPSKDFTASAPVSEDDDET